MCNFFSKDCCWNNVFVCIFSEGCESAGSSPPENGGWWGQSECWRKFAGGEDRERSSHHPGGAAIGVLEQEIHQRINSIKQSVKSTCWKEDCSQIKQSSNGWKLKLNCQSFSTWNSSLGGFHASMSSTYFGNCNHFSSSYWRLLDSGSYQANGAEY